MSVEPQGTSLVLREAIELNNVKYDVILSLKRNGDNVALDLSHFVGLPQGAIARIKECAATAFQEVGPQATLIRQESNGEKQVRLANSVTPATPRVADAIEGIWQSLTSPGATFGPAAGPSDAPPGRSQGLRVHVQEGSPSTADEALPAPERLGRSHNPYRFPSVSPAPVRPPAPATPETLRRPSLPTPTPAPAPTPAPGWGEWFWSMWPGNRGRAETSGAAAPAAAPNAVPNGSDRTGEAAEPVPSPQPNGVIAADLPSLMPRAQGPVRTTPEGQAAVDAYRENLRATS